MEPVDHSNRPQPEDQDGGGLPGWAGTSKGLTHNISTAHALHTSPWTELHPKGPLPSRHIKRHQPLDGTQRLDNYLH
jgi:hypothetical protein